MALVLDLRSGPDKAYDGWVRAGRPAFMRSQAYALIHQSLRRYLRREVPGLSFLIAGHRGVGKTSLVGEVADAVTGELFDLWAAAAQAFEAWERTPTAEPPDLPPERQRPLLVRLHGPSLVTSELPRPGGGETSGGAAPRSDARAKASFAQRRAALATIVEVNVSGTPAKDAGPADRRAEATPAGQSHAALVQIMIGLYRALAREVGEAAAIRALGSVDDEARRTRGEFAAELRLALDTAPGPEALRAYWDEIESATRGFLWPEMISQVIARHAARDQHYREITAVATAAQAFQVCSGSVTYNQTRKDTQTREETTETKTSLVPAGALDRLATLGVGGLLGYGLGGAAGAGLGMVASLGVTAISKRTSRRETTDDYTFIVDRSVETLERDVPQVIERVRAAGLAPVFVVDELDKLPVSGLTGVMESIRDIIGRLKHLTTDYGFFAFLTDRDYFDDVERLVRSGTYPVEHTFFSERLLIGYGPKDFDDYARSVIACTEGEILARFVLIKHMILRSGLNTTTFFRHLRRNWVQTTDRTEYAVPAAELATSTAYLLSATVQLAIERECLSQPYADRMRDDPAFRQMAFDTLYRVARLWRDDQKVIDMAPAAIALDLLSRRGRADVTVDNALSELKAEIGDAECDLLLEMAERLIGSLCRLKQLFDVIAASGPTDPDFGMIREIGLALTNRRIEAIMQREGETAEYKVLYNPDGTSHDDAQTRRNARFWSGIVGETLDTLRGLGATLDDLEVIGRPSTTSHAVILPLVARLRGASQDTDVSAASREATPLLEVISFLTRARLAIGGLMELVMDMIRETGQMSPALTMAQIAQAIRRHIHDPEVALSFRPMTQTIRREADEILAMPNEFPAPELPATSSGEDAFREALHQWGRDVLARRAGPPGRAGQVRLNAAWAGWRNRLLLAMTDATMTPPVLLTLPTLFDDLILCVQNRLPSRLLHYDLAQVDRFAWSELALASISTAWPVPARGQTSTPQDPVPAWAAIAALRRLDFGRTALESLLERRTSIPADEADPRDFLPEATSLSVPASLLVSDPAADPAVKLEAAPGNAYIRVTPSLARAYAAEIDLLIDAGVIGIVLHER